MSRPRPPRPTLAFIDDHCRASRSAFPDVRSFEHFKALHAGLLSDLPRKTLPAIARFLGLADAQGLHHMLTSDRIATEALRRTRTDLVRAAVGHRPVTLLVDETGDRKKGRTTDYVSRQYLGSLGKLENGLVTVHVVALVGQVTFPLLFEVFKPERRLKPGERHRSKIQIAIGLLDEVASWGLEVELVVADALYGEAGDFVQALARHRWPYVLAVRRDHAMFLPAEQEVYALSWQGVERHLTGGRVEQRWAQEVIYGVPRRVRFFVLTSDREKQAADQTSFVMTNLPAPALPGRLADAYGRRTYVEEGFRHLKTELGWHDWRLTAWAHIERWYEVALSAYAVVSIEALRRAECADGAGAPDRAPQTGRVPEAAPSWRGRARLKHTLEDMRGWVRALGAAVLLATWLPYLSCSATSALGFLAQLRALPFPN